MEYYENEGYEFVQICYQPFVSYETVNEEVPQFIPYTSGGSIGISPPVAYASKTIPVVKQEPKALMKLTKTAQVLHGD
jgi:hypothetical protein